MNETTTSKKRILIVDDDTEMRNILRESLNNYFKESIQITEAADGLEGSFKIENQNFDCIITDLKMPKRDGGDFIKNTKLSSTNKYTPIIIITGNINEIIENEYNDIYTIEKPFDTKRLVSMVNTQLRLGKLHQRVNAETLNFLSKATQNYLNNQTPNHTFNVDKPIVKKVGETLSLSTIFMIEVSTENENSTMCIGLDEQITEHLIGHSQQKDSQTTDPLTSILNDILKRFNCLLSEAQNKSPVYKNKYTINSQDHFKHQTIRDSTGITVYMNSTLGQVSITTMNRHS